MTSPYIGTAFKINAFFQGVVVVGIFVVVVVIGVVVVVTIALKVVVVVVVVTVAPKFCDDESEKKIAEGRNFFSFAPIFFWFRDRCKKLIFGFVGNDLRRIEYHVRGIEIVRKRTRKRQRERMR